MTRRDLITVGSKTELAEAAEQMVSQNIRHLPIVDGGNVVGIVSIRDMTRWAAEELSGGHEMPDIASSHAALQAASELQSSAALRTRLRTAARRNGSRGSSSDPSCARSRGKNSATVQSIAIRTRRPTSASRSRW